MTIKEIIDGLKFTVDMFLFDPTTGETYKEPRNDMDKTTIDACNGAIELLEQDPILDKIRAEIEQLPTTKCTETHRIYIDADDFKKNVLVILDKYKAESEEV